MFQRVLAGWDGSRPARRAFDLAVDLARRYDAELVAASVVHSPAHAETEADRLESLEGARRQLVRSFATVSDRAGRVGVPVEHVLIEGDRDRPADDLLAYAHEHAFDLVVVGHHRGRGGRLVVHGLVERLVASSDVPVLVVTEGNGDRG
jgi:nucleotide-binding universal stress UspA family protein